jgi:hypothetical protein
LSVSRPQFGDRNDWRTGFHESSSTSESGSSADDGQVKIHPESFQVSAMQAGLGAKRQSERTRCVAREGSELAGATPRAWVMTKMFCGSLAEDADGAYEEE